MMAPLMAPLSLLLLASPAMSQFACSNTFTAAGLVPSKLPSAPPGNLRTSWTSSRLRLSPNLSSVDTRLMVERPSLLWRAEAGALYTVMMVDEGIERLEGKQYIHWMVENVPGTMVHLGDEVMEYVPPFYFNIGATGSLVIDGRPGHPVLTLIYKQSARISMTERQSGCNAGLASRIGDKTALARQYDLSGPVAGNFLYTMYSRATDQLLCKFTRCTGRPFPAPLPGVNDGPQCKGEKTSVAAETPRTQAEEPRDKVEEVAPGVYSFSSKATKNEYNSMFIITGEGVIGIEPVNTGHSTAMLSAIASVTSEPVKFLLHSHNHWDHGSGGGVWREAGATIIAHHLAFSWMEANTGRDMVLPDQTWGKTSDTFLLQLGNTSLELRYVGMNHGLGNTVFLLPDLKIAYLADIVTPKRVMFTIVPDFNLKEWERSLEEVLLIDFEKAVYSHSEDRESRLLGSKQDVVEELEFMRDLKAEVLAMLMKGLPTKTVAADLRLPKYETWAYYDEYLSLNVWRVMMDMWMGPFPWVPEADTANKIQSGKSRAQPLVLN